MIFLLNRFHFAPANLLAVALLAGHASLLADGPSGEDAAKSYNRAVQLYQASQFDQAAQWFGQAATSRDDVLAARARYNLGNSRYAAATSLMRKLTQPAGATASGGGDDDVVDPAGDTNANPLDLLQQAVGAYHACLRLTPDDSDARFNLENAQRLIQQLSQQNSDQQNPDQQNPDQQNPDQQSQDANDQSQTDQGQGKQADQEQQEQQPQQEGDASESQQTDDQASEDGDSSEPDPSADSPDEASGTDPQQTPSDQESSEPQEEPQESDQQESDQQESDQQESDQQSAGSSSEADPEPQPQDSQSSGEDGGSTETPPPRATNPGPDGQSQNAGEDRSSNLDDSLDPADVPRAQPSPSPAIATNQPDPSALTPGETRRLLQAIRDRDMQRRKRLEELKRARRIIVPRDW